MRPFRFIAEPGDFSDGRSLAESARRAESMGYSALVYPDHLVSRWGVIPLLATIAAATDRIRIQAFVLNNDLRHPAILAQDLATLDVLSGGRLEVAIGAGWNKPEYDAIGLPFDPVGVRVSRLAESIRVLKGAFADGPFSFQGVHYIVTNHDGQPKPAQRPHPPFFVGGGGRRLLTIAAREADTVGLAPRIHAGERFAADPRSITVEATEEKIGWVREAAPARFADLVFNVYPSTAPVIVTDHARTEATEWLDRLRSRTGIDIGLDAYLASPHVFIGSIEGLAEKFVELRERLGISSVMVGDIDGLAPLVERLAGT
jgi:probable F420-dependent oxidoreductase